jgi:hypothetical protein
MFGVNDIVHSTKYPYLPVPPGKLRDYIDNGCYATNECFTAIFDPAGIISPNQYKEINSYIYNHNEKNKNYEIIIIMLNVCSKFIIYIKYVYCYRSLMGIMKTWKLFFISFILFCIIFLHFVVV